MKILLPLMLKFFWVPFILFTCFVTYLGWRSVQNRIHKLPELEAGYRKLFKWYAFWCSIPWLIMGILFLSEDAKSFMDSLGEPPILLWGICLLLLLLLLLFWVFFQRGAETLEKHPGLPLIPQWDARKLRYFFIGLTLANIAVFAFLALQFEELSKQFRVIVFVIFFLGMWVMASYLVGAIGGWNILAKHYQAESDFQGEKLRSKSGQMGLMSYGSCLVLGMIPPGFYLATSWLFRVGHPDLMIPWEDITVTLKKRWLFSSAEFEFSKCPGIVLTVSKRLAEKIANESSGQLKIS